MSKFIKKFESFSKSKVETAAHGEDMNNDESKEMTLDQFKKCHNYMLSGKWDERDDVTDFENMQKNLDKYKNLSDADKKKYLGEI